MLVKVKRGHDSEILCERECELRWVTAFACFYITGYKKKKLLESHFLFTVTPSIKFKSLTLSLHARPNQG